MPIRRQKVMIYLTSGDRLLLLDHPDHPHAGQQVPAGTLEPGEDPVAGAHREAREETGLDRLAFVRILGETVIDMRPWGRDEVHHRTCVHLRCEVETPDEWEWWEEHPDDAPGERIRFRLYWRRVSDIPPLIGGHDAFLHLLEPDDSRV